MASSSGQSSSSDGVSEKQSFDQTTQKPEDVISSLLAGVNLSSSPYAKSDMSTVVDWSSPSLHQTRSINGGNTAGVISSSAFSNGQRIPSRSQLLFGTDMNDLKEPSTPIGNQSIDLFLSQSPSQTLGDEVYQFQRKFNEQKNGLSTGHGVNNWNDRTRHRQHIGISGEHQGGLRRMESPPNSVTATSSSSRSVSPSLFGGNNDRSHPTIQAFQNHTNMDALRPGSHMVGIGSHSAQLLQLPKNSHKPLNNQALGVDPYIHHSMQQTQQTQHPAAGPHVLYMAVPTPDGRGQMFQAVQVVQMPGGAQTFVLPASGQYPPVADIPSQPFMVPSQPMVVLPQIITQQPSVASNDTNKSPKWADPFPLSPDANNQYLVDRRSNNGEDYSNPISRLGSNERVSPSQSGGNGADVIASLYSASQRPPLDALLGHVRRLSRDQVGCRLLQQALDEEGTMASTLILNEGIAFWGEAMVDPFGNYLFQKILEKITPEERITLIKSVGPRLVNASLNLHGTRSVQKVVELCAADEIQWPDVRDPIAGTSAEILTSHLSPAAVRLCIDSHGNHVIQRVLQKLGHRHSKFVFDAVANSVGDVARHRHGCCVIQRCLDSPPSKPRNFLVRRIVQKSLELMQDAYGNYVVQYVLDVCGSDDVNAVCESVAGKVCLLAIQKFSSNVMEKCLERANDRIKEIYLTELSDTERIRELMMDPFGNYVVQRALAIATHAQAIRLVEAMRPHLISSQPGAPNGQRNGGMRNTAGGRRIMAKICRRFPNFTLSGTMTLEELYSQNKSQRKSQHSAGTPFHQTTSPVLQHLSPLQQYGGYSLQGHHVARDDNTGPVRQPYYDARQGYYDHAQSGHPNYHTQM